MQDRTHSYDVRLQWTGNLGEGTNRYEGYSRDHEFHAGAKPMIAGSSDPSFRGDRDRWNPEELLLASVAACHKLWYLHLCFDHGVNVVAYEDDATGTMTETPDGGGQFTSVTLRPKVTISATSDADLARRIHAKVDPLCFIARSVNFPINCAPIIAKEKS